MRIAWLNGNPNPNFGGTEIHTIQMVKELKKEGIDLFLVCAKNSYVDRNTQDVEKYYISFPNSLAIINTFKLSHLLRDKKPDFIVANNGKEYPNALLAGKLSKTKVVFFRHMERMKQYLVRKLVFPYVDMFMAVSERVKRNLIEEGVKEEKIRVIYNVIDEERFFYKEKPKDTINLLFVGKLDEGKGVWDLLEAFSSLYKQEESLRAYLVGDGRLREQIISYINQKGLQKAVNLVGYTPKVEEYYQLSHICVIPSKTTEAFSRVAIEALACGCALVVSNVGGIKEAVREGENGYVFQAGDIKDLINKLKETIKNWDSFSKNSMRLYREKFSRDKVIRDFLASLTEIL